VGSNEGSRSATRSSRPERSRRIRARAEALASGRADPTDTAGKLWKQAQRIRKDRDGG
jgi:hypothetical protein